MLTLHVTQRQLKKALKHYENKNLKQNTKNTTDKTSASVGTKNGKHRLTIQKQNGKEL